MKDVLIIHRNLVGTFCDAGRKLQQVRDPVRLERHNQDQRHGDQGKNHDHRITQHVFQDGFHAHSPLLDRDDWGFLLINRKRLNAEFPFLGFLKPALELCRNFS